MVKQIKQKPEKKREELTVWAGFSPEQLEAIKGGETKVLVHKEKE